MRTTTGRGRAQEGELGAPADRILFSRPRGKTNSEESMTERIHNGLMMDDYPLTLTAFHWYS